MKKLIITALICLAGCTAAFPQQCRTKAFQFGFITPVGTNGLMSGSTENKVSVNLLAGYSCGNTIAEVGVMANINRYRTSGVQVAGMANYSGKADRAIQVAGVTNIVADGQTAVQISGIAGITGTNRGVQIAGIFNYAEKQSGLQIGLVNVADESDGVSLGLINIVRKGGKYELEISASETFHTAASFRMGTNRLYTIFAGGANFSGRKTDFGAGLGLGTHLQWKKGWANQIEVTGYSLTCEGRFTEYLNMMAQLRLTASKEIVRHFKVFAGPSLNISVSDNRNVQQLSPWCFSQKDNGRNTTKLWAGICAGVRF